MESTGYKEARTTSRKRGMMKQLFAITPDNLPMDATLEIMSEIAPIVDFIQVREKSLSPLEQDQLIETALLNGIPPQKLIINDRIDLALLHGLNHVHLTERSILLQRAQIGFPALSFSRSVHSLTQIMAHHLHASYLQIGHIFPTALKNYPPFGLENLKKASTIADNLVAVGGIDHTTLLKVRPYVMGVAVMSALFEHANPASYAQTLISLLND